MLTWKCLPIISLALLAGCEGYGAPSFRSYTHERLNDGSLQTTDTAIANVRGLKPQLQFPCRIAIYLKPGEHEWRWTPDDKTAMLKWANELKQAGIASDVFALPDLVANADGKTDVRALRIAAARCGADVLFVIHGAVQTEGHKNLASVFDLTIVGGFIIPASHRDSLFTIEGILLDVDNGYIYTAVQAEGEGKIMRPTFVIEDKDAVDRAKFKALELFGGEVLAHMRALTATPPSPRVYNYANIQTDDPKPKAVAKKPVESAPVAKNPAELPKVNAESEVIPANGIILPKP